MIHLSLIGIGTGNPDHLTGAAIKAINQADLILLPRKGNAKSDLIDLRRHILADVLTSPARLVEFDMPERDGTPSYLDGVTQWHDAIAALWTEQISRHLPKGGTLALLVWGDPSLYDSSLRIAQRLGPEIEVSVVPGISSIQALTAAHAICLNELAEPVLITTGRRLREDGWPSSASRVVVMLDGQCAFQTLLSGDIDIWWGAYLGMPHQALLAGPLQSMGAEIIHRRAALRQQHGWIMDIYMLHRRTSEAGSSLNL